MPVASNLVALAVSVLLASGAFVWGAVAPAAAGEVDRREKEIRRYLSELEEYGKQRHRYNISPVDGQLLEMLVRLSGAGRALEVGTANGYSAIWIALGLKANGFEGEIVGWDRQEVLQKAKERGAIDRGTTEVNAAAAEADLIYLATPVTLILELLPAVGRAARAGALVTDTGSTKARICRLAKEALPDGVHFLGGHPLAGKERSGVENAEAALFKTAKYVVVKEAKETGEAEEADEKADPSLSLRMTDAEEEFLGWVRRLGAEPVEMDAETHDWAAALTSHLPQLLSTALASAVWDETDEDGLPLSLAAGGFREMTRLAASPYEVWRDICLTNSENIGRALERLEHKLERLRTHLRSKELAEEFAQAQQTCAMLKGVIGGSSDE